MARWITIEALGMNDRTNNLNLTDEQKTRLFALGLEPISPADVVDEDEMRGNLLCDFLRSKLPWPEHRSHVTNKGTQASGSVSALSLGEVLRDPQSEIYKLTRIKDYAKALGTRSSSDVEKDVFLAVYFVAIAAAMRFSGERITNHSIHDLVHFLDSFSKASWMPSDLARLLQEAGRSCCREQEMQPTNEDE